jgi:hypothetical protein
MSSVRASSLHGDLHSRRLPAGSCRRMTQAESL